MERLNLDGSYNSHKQYTYDNLGRTLSEGDYTNTGNELISETTYEYTVTGYMHESTDQLGSGISYFRDNLGRLTEKVVEYATQHDVYRYDAFGNLVTYIDRYSQGQDNGNGQNQRHVTDYQYDNLGRRTKEIWRDVSSLANDGAILGRDSFSDLPALYEATHTYTALGELDEASDVHSEYSYSYDVLRRVNGITQNLTALPSTPFVFSYEHDLTGNRTRLSSSVNGDADFINTYDFDDLGRLQRLKQSQSGTLQVRSKTIDYLFGTDGLLEDIFRYESLNPASEYDSIVSSNYSYNDDGRLATILHQGRNPGATQIYQYTYKYDPSSRIAQIDSQDHDDLAFEYDDLYQLTALDSLADAQDESFEYDLLGNRNARYSAGSLLMESADARFLYDPNGNVIQQ